MGNLLTLAVAGSGKTQQLAEHCATLPRDRRVLAVTFTQANQVELGRRIQSIAGNRQSIEVVGWYTFLLRHLARPFFPFRFPGRRIEGFNFEGRPNRFAKGIHRFLDRDGAIYACELGRISSELIELTSGALRRRLQCCFDEILIDEVQDLAAHDWDILDFLLDTCLTIRMVGDFRQALLSTNPRSAKHKKYAYSGALEWFDEREQEERLEVQVSAETWRCRPEIAAFSDLIYEDGGGFPPTKSNNKTVTGHDGVYWVHPEDVHDYVRRFGPQCLRDSSKSGTEFDFDYINFGSAKGTEYERVLVVPTGPIREFVWSRRPLKPKSAARFYVAASRAAQSLALLLEKPGESGILQWRPTDR